MKKIQLLVVLVLLCGFNLKAQYTHPLDVENQYPGDEKAKAIYDDALHTSLDSSATAVRTTWLANRPGDNWFISAGAGASILLSEETRYMDFGDQISAPSFQFSVGKWFSPVWGLRINATYSNELKGFATWSQEGPNGRGFGSWFIGKNYPSEVNNAYGMKTNTYLHAFTAEGAAEVYERFLKDGDYIETDKGNGYTYNVEYVGGTVDFLLNLKNLFTTYNHKAFFNPVLYAGLGYAHTFGDKDNDITAVNSMMMKAGLQFNFRLCDSWDLFVDAQGLLLPEAFDRRVGDDQTQDVVASLMAGLTYRINFRHFIKAPIYDQREIDALNREINELRNRPEVICPPVVVCPPVVEPEPEPFVLTPVFFTLDSYIVRDNQWLSIAKAAEYLVENPNSKLRIAAYADKNTGNPAHNMKLSENRAKAVANVLVEKFGVNRNRLEIEFYGDKVQPFAENDWNRVAIFALP